MEIVGACFLFVFGKFDFSIFDGLIFFSYLIHSYFYLFKKGALLIFKVFIFIILKIEKNNFFIRTRDLVTNLHKNKLKIENLT